MMGPRGFEKHSIVWAKLTNTFSRYQQEGTIYTLIGLAESRLTRWATKTRFTQVWSNITSVLQCLYALEVKMYIDHIMCNKKHVWCGITDVFWIGAYRAEIVQILTFCYFITNRLWRAPGREFFFPKRHIHSSAHNDLLSSQLSINF